VIRRVAMLCFALSLVFGGPLAAVAQDGSPVPAGPVGPELGTAVSWFGAEGTEVAKVTVDDLVDPYQDYDPNSPPQRGFHFVVISVTIENTGTRPVNVDPSAFAVVDADGFLARSSYLSRSAEDTASNPDLQYAELAAGATVSGVIGFQVLNGVEVERVVFMPEGNSIITLVDRRPARTPLGTTSSIIGTEGTEIAQVSVDELIDPYQDYDPSSPPERGSHFVVITVTLINTGTRPLPVDPSGFYLIDEQGFIAYQTYLYRADATNPPDFAYGELAPGASQTGLIAYQVLNGTDVAAVIYAADYYNQQLIVAEPGPEGWPAPTTRPTTPTATEPTAEPVAISAEDCAALVTWAQAMVARFGQFGTILAPLSAIETQPNPTVDPTVVRQAADQLAALAEEQRNSNPPEPGKELNTALADVFQQFADALNKLADAAEANDTASVAAALAEFESVAGAFETGGELERLAAPLTAACPDLENVVGG
jgi:hypothetical protein